jgi:hypothetical protein
LVEKDPQGVSMGKIKKFASLNIRKITGGKDPVRIVEDFISRRGFDPRECQKEATPDLMRWMFALRGAMELEVLVEGVRKPAETTIYMGVNIITVPIRGAGDILAAALEIADGLVGIKVSLVGHYLVLSASLSAVGVTVDDLEYNLKLIDAQESWFRGALATELQWEDVPLE